MRPKGATTICLNQRLKDGTYDKYCQGYGIDIGGKNDPLVIPGRKIDMWDKEQGDARLMEGVPDNKYDFVYASHILEHIQEVGTAISSWCKICKPGGYIYIIVPDFELYEKLGKQKFNKDHKAYFSLKTPPAIPVAAVVQLIRLMPDICYMNNVQLQFLSLNDTGYDYSLPDDIDQTRNGACAHIEMMLKKNG